MARQEQHHGIKPREKQVYSFFFRLGTSSGSNPVADIEDVAQSGV